MALGLAALFLLAKAHKENLGKLYSVSAYVVLTVSILVILFSITAGIMHCCHGGGCSKGKSGHGCKGGKSECSMMKGDCGSESACSSGKESCSGSCEKGGSSCSMGGKMKGHCMKGGDCMMNAHGKMHSRKIIKMIDGDSVNVDVKVIEE